MFSISCICRVDKDKNGQISESELGSALSNGEDWVVFSIDVKTWSCLATWF